MNKKIIVGLKVSGSLLLIAAVHQEITTKVICTTTTTVKSIDSLEYRSAYITLQNGQRIKVNQAMLNVLGSLKPGSVYCLQYKRIPLKDLHGKS